MAASTRSSILLILATVACGFPRPADVGDDDEPNTTYQLVALEPATATTGDTITLEGTFAQTATVHFPGGTSQPATILGSHRASVAVPETATAGDLTVETGGTTIGPLVFRRTSFALGLQPFETPFAQLNGARQRSTLETGRSGHTAAVVGNTVYVLGGISGGRYLDSVERAIINADGSLGPFTAIRGVTLATPRSGHTSVLIGSFLYVLGGSNTTGILKSVERAVIAADGSLGPFDKVSGLALANAREAAATAVIGTSVYVIGGSGVLGSLERAIINPDGSLGSFATVDGIRLNAARSGHTVAVVGSKLYVLGGSANGITSGSIERATINPDGSLGVFDTISELSLATARSGHTSAVVGSFLYALGGVGSTGPLNSVERAAISPDGSLGSFTTVNSVTLGTARSAHASVLARNFLYLLGGTTGVTDLTSLERTTINADGSVGTFAATSDVHFTTARSGYTTAVVGPYLYLLGGDSPSSVERASVALDGRLGPFTAVPGVTLVEPRSGFTSVIVKDYLYVIGGSLTESVERATINSDGSLGPFAVVSGVTLSDGRSGLSSSVIADFVYIFGGANDNGQGYWLSVEKATISPDGSLSTFSPVLGVQLAFGGAGKSSIIAGGYLYSLGGAIRNPINGAIGVSDHEERAAISDDGSLGPFTDMSVVANITLATPRANAGCVTEGSSLYMVGGISGKGIFGGGGLDSIESATMNPDGSLGPFAIISGVKLATTTGRVKSVSLGNYLYTFGEQRFIGDTNMLDQATLP
jgi:Kelch motif